MLTVVTGPPCSGKTTYVAEHSRAGDVLIDFDVLAQALGSPVTHDHGPAFVAVTRAARAAAIRTALGLHRRGARVWVVECDPPSVVRQRYHVAGARFVALSAPRAELHRRADGERPVAWHGRIDQWLARRVARDASH